jgi:malonate decarboxylase beta subunit
VQDDSAEVRATVAKLFRQGVPPVHRSERHADFLRCLEHVDTTSQPTAADVRAIYQKGFE